MYKCCACHKQYSSEYSLKKHLKRQPLCGQWLELSPGIKDYVDDKFMLPMTDLEKKELSHKCFICGTTFANVGNLNRHLDQSLICSKWSMYKDLTPLLDYVGHDKHIKYAKFIKNQDKDKDKDKDQEEDQEEDQYQASNVYERFDPPAYSICHIIWNIFLIDKELASNPNFKQIVRDNNIQYILALLPDEAIYKEKISVDVPHHIMTYDGHDMNMDIESFDAQIKVIEAYRKERANVFIFCNNGYQRSIPFLCYYLIKYHSDEVPGIEQAIDIILSQADKENYTILRSGYIERVTQLFKQNNVLHSGR